MAVTQIIGSGSDVVRSRGRPAANAGSVPEEAELLAAAFAVFAERGYDSTSIRDLSGQLGISHNLLNVRFGKKEDLWKAAVDWRFAGAGKSVEKVFASKVEPEQRLRDLIHAFGEWAISNGDIVCISHLEVRNNDWRIDFIHERFSGPFQARLELLLDEVRQQRPVATLSGGSLLVMLIYGMGMYFAAPELRERLEGKGAFGIAKQRQRAREFAEFILGGLLGQMPEGQPD